MLGVGTGTTSRTMAVTVLHLMEHLAGMARLGKEPNTVMPRLHKSSALLLSRSEGVIFIHGHDCVSLKTNPTSSTWN